MCNTFTLKNEDGLSFVEESQDRMKLITVKMSKVDLKKPLSDMNEQEKMIYYFLNWGDSNVREACRNHIG